MIDVWEVAWRSADSPEKGAWLLAQATERGELQEALCGLLRSTYVAGRVATPKPGSEAPAPAEAVTEGEWWE